MKKVGQDKLIRASIMAILEQVEDDVIGERLGMLWARQAGLASAALLEGLREGVKRNQGVDVGDLSKIEFDREGAEEFFDMFRSGVLSTTKAVAAIGVHPESFAVYADIISEDQIQKMCDLSMELNSASMAACEKATKEDFIKYLYNIALVQ